MSRNADSRPGSAPGITIFTAPKPFTGTIEILQRNALASWAALGSRVEILVMADEPGCDQVVRDLGLRSGGPVDRNPQGTPLLGSIFSRAKQMAKYEILAYLNADILLTDDFLPAVERVRRQFDPFMMVGGRWDLDVNRSLEFTSGWSVALREEARLRGVLHPPEGSDYFVFPRHGFPDLPPFALGRSGWDNWMIYRARCLHWPVIDATAAVSVIHQNHDYSHLPGGQSHHRLPESVENLRLAGGRRTVFTLRDADWQLTRAGLRTSPWTLRRALRRLETYPLIRWRSRLLAEAVFLLLHPCRAWGEWRGRAASAWSRRWQRRMRSNP